MMQQLLEGFNSVLVIARDFDQDEWFILINMLGFLWVIFLAKRFPLIVKILVLLFSMVNAVAIDHSIAASPLDLNDIGDQATYELFDELGYLMYTPYAYLSVYLYHKFNPKGLKFTLYVILMSLVTADAK